MKIVDKQYYCLLIINNTIKNGKIDFKNHIFNSKPDY